MDKNLPYSQQGANNVAEEIRCIYLARAHINDTRK